MAFRDQRYTLYYNPEYRIDSANHEHPKDWNVLKLEEKLQEDIAENGLINPLFVTRSASQDVIHPGKCRAHALLRLGQKTAPALIYDPTKSGPRHAGEQPIDREEAKKLFSGDAYAQCCWRFFAVKKSTKEWDACGYSS